VLRLRVTIEASTAHACNFETAHYLVFIYVLVNRAVRIISHIATNFYTVVENYSGKGEK
jgi:hypothetical protein